jgi:hypothetical protein
VRSSEKFDHLILGRPTKSGVETGHCEHRGVKKFNKATELERRIDSDPILGDATWTSWLQEGVLAGLAIAGQVRKSAKTGICFRTIFPDGY